MIIWLFLFLVVIIISFILAYQSMKDYQQEQPILADEQGVFLVRAAQNLTAETLDQLHQVSWKNKSQICIERLFKGDRQALIIYGSKKALEGFSNLELLELEDYAMVSQNVLAWEVAVKDPVKFHLEIPQIAQLIFKDLPPLEQEEQIWFQLLLSPKSGNILPQIKSSQDNFLSDLLKKVGILSSLDPQLKSLIKESVEVESIFKSMKGQRYFDSQIRMAFLGTDERIKALSEKLFTLAEGKLTKLPRPLTSSQIFNFYKNRKFMLPLENKLVLTTGEVNQLFVSA